MNIEVTFRHMNSSDALRSYVEDKLDKLDKLLVEPVNVHVVLSVEKIRQIAEITLHTKDFSANALEESNDLYASIDLAMDKLDIQVKKHKEKIKNHKLEPYRAEV